MKKGKRTAVIVAGGESTRFEKNKLFASLYGKTVIEVTVGAFEGIADEIILVSNEKDLDRMKLLFKDKVTLVEGGHTRTLSVINGLHKAADEGTVAIHDGARPFVSQKLVEECFKNAEEKGSAIPVTNAVDTVYLSTAEGIKFFDRNNVCCVQTPQVFETAKIKQAYKERDQHKAYSDDSQVYLEKFGKIEFVQGERTNKKITFPSDLYGESIGSGFDAHRLVENRKLILCGVEIPFEKGLLGHSDADAATHAIMDAVLSSIGEKDIGQQFPDSDPQYKDACSIDLLKKVAEKVKAKNAAVQSISCTVIAQSPKLSPYVSQMEKNIAAALGISPSRVSVNATTTENLGITAQGKGIAAQAVCLTTLN